MMLFAAGVGLRQLSAHWFESRDGEAMARDLFDRHYSRKVGADSKLFIGPGDKWLLISYCGSAIFAWRKYISDDGQKGVNCAVFRNEGIVGVLSSDLIRQADELADAKWPGERHFTYVDPKKVRSTNPGACFIAAGWRRCGVTKKRKLLIFERKSPK